MFVLILAVAAAEVAVALAFLLALRRHIGGIDVDAAAMLRG